MSSIPSGAPPSHVWTVSNCTIHSTHSVYYSILHIFMFRDLRIMLQCELLFLWNWYNHYNRVPVVYGATLRLPPRGWVLPSSLFLLTLTQKWSRSCRASVFFHTVCRRRTDVGWSERWRNEWSDWVGRSIRAAEQSQKKCGVLHFKYTGPLSSSYVCGFTHDSSVCVILKVWFGLVSFCFSVVG